MPRKSTKPPKPKDKPVTSPEQWQIIEYYAKHGAPKVKKVARQFLSQRDAAAAGSGSSPNE